MIMKEEQQNQGHSSSTNMPVCMCANKILQEFVGIKIEERVLSTATLCVNINCDPNVWSW